MTIPLHRPGSRLWATAVIVGLTVLLSLRSGTRIDGRAIADNEEQSLPSKQDIDAKVKAARDSLKDIQGYRNDLEAALNQLDAVGLPAPPDILTKGRRPDPDAVKRLRQDRDSLAERVRGQAERVANLTREIGTRWAEINNSAAQLSTLLGESSRMQARLDYAKSLGVDGKDRLEQDSAAAKQNVSEKKDALNVLFKNIYNIYDQLFFEKLKLAQQRIVLEQYDEMARLDANLKRLGASVAASPQFP